jgi:hypothetical protein
MTGCSRPNCFAPETSCDLGNLDHSKCPAWKEHKETSGSQGEEVTDELLLPWSGSALGLADLGFVAGRSRPFVVGIVGPQNAGKTTLLAAWYLLVGRGLAGFEKRRFAGSYSLAGWEAVASSLRCTPGNQPSFPPHTSSRDGRGRGLLHLALRDADGNTRSYLFTDAPGEWFQKWAVNRDAIDADGARWVAEYADIFLLIADCDALSGSHLGLARGAMHHHLVDGIGEIALRGHSAKLGLERLHSVLTLHFDVSVELNPSAEQIPRNRQRAIHDEGLLFAFGLRLRQHEKCNRKSPHIMQLNSSRRCRFLRHC